jgi:hypothetical protein
MPLSEVPKTAIGERPVNEESPDKVSKKPRHPELASWGRPSIHHSWWGLGTERNRLRGRFLLGAVMCVNGLREGTIQRDS